MYEEENQDNQAPIPEEEQPQEKKKEGNNMRKLIYGLMIVAVITVVAACAPMVMENQTDNLTPEPIPQDSWTVDLSEIGVGVVNFSPRDDSRSPREIGYFSSFVREQECYILYDRVLLGLPLESFDLRFEFSNDLLVCGLEHPTNTELLSTYVALGQPFELYTNWLSEYESSCGESLYRAGWLSDFETDVNLSCAPTLEDMINQL